MKKICLFLILFMISIPVFSDVMISKTQGLVEVMKPGTTTWVKAEEGSTLSMNSRISTGFNSTATLLINDSSEVTVKALTRITVEEISGNGSSGDQNTRLFMGSGRINASVKKNEASIHDFRVRTPVSTAAVRGTEFDMSPGSLSVNEGVVRFTVGNFSFGVSRGQASRITMINGQPGLLSPSKEAMVRRRVRTNTGQTDGDDDGEDSGSQSGKTGYAVITLY
ncbi:hypothetical protein EXM22_03015 [Oceanispirochaeta crateris]|uniref:FecR protein domain-containing protein n=1 Tax=Oceanispirochaeta crateris TaxID=2518645 RepID=A0A5C1QG12_9SPIO|nr:FecR domain-containing protein [Oceanispirochaeta crateris]QEN07005.1 hypothetical protein EXM22_03015 [Oceanispirochaeta crateris]